MVYHSLKQFDLTPHAQPSIPRPRRVLLTTPTFFDVRYVINPHMEAHLGSVVYEEAAQQWGQLRDTYEQLGIDPVILEGVKELPDMVFCANQTLPYYRQDKERGVVLSHMHASQRRPEVTHYEQFFQRQGYNCLHLPRAFDFEGMGDAIWHPRRYLLWGGYGIRTDPAAYDALTSLLAVPIVALRLVDPTFYHLDTCFCTLDEQTVLVFPGAFEEDGLALIRAGFDHVIEAPEDEARRRLACNAHCPDGHHVLIQQGCRETNRRLREAGFEPVEVDTGEFLKAGGSVFCMKQMFW